MKNRLQIGHSELLDLFTYSPDSGLFFWRKPAPARRRGQPAGCITSRGYVCIQVHKSQYLAHRLAWFYIHGKWPDRFIDHANGNPSDNRIENLREADHCENGYNRRRRNDCGSGIKGVSLCPQTQMWKAGIQVNKKYHHLGRFTNKTAAAEAYRSAAHRLCGAFARPD